MQQSFFKLHFDYFIGGIYGGDFFDKNLRENFFFLEFKAKRNFLYSLPKSFSQK